ncbi:hypothetical protein ACFZCL_31510 [Streptomyces sp. NPDC008159]|uniref:hypothetical protein n=1 Tax=Streptomyces sp. NPDC008159 TaxID=3364817 RepID=UPI0036EBCB3A
MRGPAHRLRAAGLAALLLTAGASACTSDSDDAAGPDARASVCTDGTYTWSGVRHRTRLTALGEPVTFPAGTDSYETRLKPLDRTVHRVTVTGTPQGTTEAGVIRALGARLKAEEPLAGPSETEGPEETAFGRHTGDLEGAYYLWREIGFVDADFAYRCLGADPVHGHVHTWERVGGGFLPCDTPPDGAAGRTAAERLCPAGSPAVKGV